ncbi:acyl-CoA thioester hydrolase [Flavobacteriaceae bacterium MAR_2010_188]|nr:acyl-CoA thioester hydrolase [Flavobacteriaceae bacterium MAR_2010_188]
MFKKEFEIRWSDIDANGHLANSAYTNFMSHTRMAFFEENNLSLGELKQENIGPVVFYEHTHYFKEAFLGTNVYVSLETTGMSEDGMFFKFEHNFYDREGKNLATCEVFGAFIDLQERKLRALPMKMFENLKNSPRSADFKILTKEDSRKFNKRPVDINA